MFEGPFVQFTLTPILAIVGAVFDLVGTGLGVLNYLLSRRTHRLAMAVDVKIEGRDQDSYGDMIPSETPTWLAIRVSIKNLSYFPVTIEEAGVLVPNGKWGTKPAKWKSESVRVEARDGTTMHFSAAVPEKAGNGEYAIRKVGASGYEEEFVQAKCFYVKPIGGKMFTGGRQAFREFKRSFPLIKEYPAKGGGKVKPTL